jgi:hypothetical protein
MHSLDGLEEKINFKEIIFLFLGVMSVFCLLLK